MLGVCRAALSLLVWYNVKLERVVKAGFDAHAKRELLGLPSIGRGMSSFTHRVCSPRPPALPLLFCIDLILILWPIFFVAATHQGPSQKPRDFKKYAAGVTGFVGVTASVEGPLKNTSMSGAQSGRPKGPTELQVEQAHWETTSPAIHSVQRLVRVCGNRSQRAWTVPPRAVLS